MTNFDELPPLNQGVSRAKYRKMLDDLRRLQHRWGNDLDEVISFFGMNLMAAQERLAYARKTGGGAPNIWTWHNLHSLWHAVRAQCRIADCTVEQACAHLAKRGYRVRVTDYSGPLPRSFEKIIRSSQALRAAFYNAEREFKALPQEARRGLKAQTEYEVRVRRGEVASASVDDIIEHLAEVAKWHDKWRSRE
jgi:hypothetical protein